MKRLIFCLCFSFLCINTVFLAHPAALSRQSWGVEIGEVYEYTIVEGDSYELYKTMKWNENGSLITNSISAVKGTKWNITIDEIHSAAIFGKMMYGSNTIELFLSFEWVYHTTNWNEYLTEKQNTIQYTNSLSEEFSISNNRFKTKIEFDTSKSDIKSLKYEIDTETGVLTKKEITSSNGDYTKLVSTSIVEESIPLISDIDIVLGLLSAIIGFVLFFRRKEETTTTIKEKKSFFGLFSGSHRSKSTGNKYEERPRLVLGDSLKIIEEIQQEIINSS